MKAVLGPALIIGSVLVLGCSGSALRWTPDYHTVREGETLHQIAGSYGLDTMAVARWNRLGDGSLIYPGQRIRLSPPDYGSAQPSDTRRARSSPPPAPGPAPPWLWPASGPVIAGFGGSSRTSSGIHIGGERGAPVVAAARGEVVYAGAGLAGYGNLLIIRHNQTWLSAYGHNEKLLVQEGDAVGQGQRIASMGEGPGRRPLLHFEIRRDGTPVNPVSYLPRR